MATKKLNTENANSPPPTNTITSTNDLNSALDKLHLDVVETVVSADEKPNADEVIPDVKLSTNSQSMEGIPPHMMGMSFHYSQMNPHMHQQGGFYPLPDFQDSNMQNPNGPVMFTNGTMDSKPGNGTNVPNLANMHAGGPSQLPSFGLEGNNMNPYNVPLPPLIPHPGAHAPLSPVWPGNPQFANNSNAIDVAATSTTAIAVINDDEETNTLEGGISTSDKTPASGTSGVRRQTFHALSTKGLIDSSVATNIDANNIEQVNNGASLVGNTTSLGVSSNVGAKTRTLSTSAGKADRDALFLQPSTDASLKESKKEDPEEEKLKDINNPNTYAAAYPYGGSLLQNNHMMGDVANGSVSGNPYRAGLHSPFPGNFDFASPYHGFSPLMGGPTPPLHPQSPIPHMGPSPIHMGPMPDISGGKNDSNDTDAENSEGTAGVPLHFQMLQHGHQHGSLPPWMYGNPTFNPMMGSPHGPIPHSPHMHLMANNNGKNYSRGNNGRGNYYGGGKGKHRNGDNNYYGQDMRRKIEDSSRFADATLTDYIGNIYSLCKDQHGCRFLQKQLDVLGQEAADSIFEETKEHTIELMTDSFGNYLIQKLIERVNLEQRIALSKIASPDFVNIALNPHGTRALQKLIECIDTPEEAEIIVSSLRDSIVELSKDLNGNHVVQKCLQKLKPEDFQFIFDATCAECLTIATHRHGCCVLQRCLDFGTKEQCQSLCDQLLSNIDKLTLDPFGNYVVQYVISKETERNDYDYTHKIVNALKPKIAELSVHKFGSNVVEKILRTPIVSETMIIELLNNGGEQDIQILLNDSYGNYVLQTALDVCHKQNEYLYEKFSDIVSPLLVGPIRNTPHGKRIASMLNLTK